MMQSTQLLAALSALAVFVAAVPAAEMLADGESIATRTAICGALDTNCPRPPIPTAQADAQRAAAAGGMTISVVNRESFALTTAHAVASSTNGQPFPRPTSGNTAPGTIAAGATAAFAVPTGWAGTVFVGNARDGALNRANGSIIEGSFIVPPSGAQVAVEDIDVSYVTGYSVPMVCSCAGTVVTGCNKDLYALGSCPTPTEGGVCENPEINNTSPTASAAPFFAPCQHDAYTYPNDNAANSYGQCGTNPIVCCVGTSCPPHP